MHSCVEVSFRCIVISYRIEPCVLSIQYVIVSFTIPLSPLFKLGWQKIRLGVLLGCDYLEFLPAESKFGGTNQGGQHVSSGI